PWVPSTQRRRRAGGIMKMSAATIVASLVLVSCAQGGEAVTADSVLPSGVSSAVSETPGSTSEQESTTSPEEPIGSAETRAACEAEPGTEFRQDGATTLEPLVQVEGVTAFAAEYPLPGPTEGLWSQWGQGIVSSVDG